MRTIHSEHSLIEKYDYLQCSKFLVDDMFKEITESIKNLKFEEKENTEKLSGTHNKKN